MCAAILKGTLILTVGGMIVKVIGSLNWIILSRVLGGAGIGLYQMAFPIYLLALSISSAGIPVAISIITAEKVALGDYEGARRVFRLSLTSMAVSGLLFAWLLFWGADWLIGERLIRDPRAYYALIALAPAVFFVTILASFRGYLQGWQIMMPTAVSQIIEQVVRVATMLWFASYLLPYGLEYAAGGASLGAAPGAVAALCVLVYYTWSLQDKLGQKNKVKINVRPEKIMVLIRRMVSLALPISLSGIMLPVVANLDLFIVPLRLEVAGYSVEQATELFGYLTGMAVPLVNLATLFTAALAVSIVPAIAETCALGARQPIYSRTAEAMRLSNLVAIPATVILGLLAEPMGTLFYHAPQAAPAIRVMAVGVFLLGLHQVTTGVLQGLGRTSVPVINMAIAALCKVGLNWILTAQPTLGIEGAAWATVADFGVAVLLNLYFIRKYTGYVINIKQSLRIVLAATLMGVVLYGVHRFIYVTTASDSMAALLAVLMGVVVYGIILLVLGELKAADITRIPIIGIPMGRFLSKIGLLKS